MGDGRSGIERSLHYVFASWRFPLTALSVLFGFALLMLVALALPVSSSPLGQFAEEFKTWCFGYDPATGRMETGYVAMMITEPFVLGGLIYLLWKGPIHDAFRVPRRLAPYPVLTVGMAVLFGAGFGLLSTTAPNGELPFPAEALRTAKKPPVIELVDQDGIPTTLEEHRGRVVVLTGVYATCGFTCPMIFSQAKRALGALTQEQRAQITVLAITLDPERDDAAALSAMSEAQQVKAPTYRLLTGDPARVNEVLDALEIARFKNPETGVIDHVNVFHVVDRQGRIAYRFSLGERQEQWLTKALELLVEEPAPGGPHASVGPR
jgi:protein SCO1